MCAAPGGKGLAVWDSLGGRGIRVVLNDLGQASVEDSLRFPAPRLVLCFVSLCVCVRVWGVCDGCIGIMSIPSARGSHCGTRWEGGASRSFLMTWARRVLRAAAILCAIRAFVVDCGCAWVGG
jgi:hypothetical protein